MNDMNARWKTNKEHGDARCDLQDGHYILRVWQSAQFGWAWMMIYKKVVVESDKGFETAEGCKMVARGQMDLHKKSVAV